MDIPAPGAAGKGNEKVGKLTLKTTEMETVRGLCPYGKHVGRW